MSKLWRIMKFSDSFILIVCVRFSWQDIIWWKGLFLWLFRNALSMAAHRYNEHFYSNSFLSNLISSSWYDLQYRWYSVYKMEIPFPFPISGCYGCFLRGRILFERFFEKRFFQILKNRFPVKSGCCRTKKPDCVL